VKPRTLAEEIRAWREAAHMTLTELAEKLGINADVCRRYEQTAGRIPVEHVMQRLEALAPELGPAIERARLKRGRRVAPLARGAKTSADAQARKQAALDEARARSVQLKAESRADRDRIAREVLHGRG
jgi:transcriptional regulator with XRE-family HTH domain